MNSLSNELKAVIGRRLEQAGPREVLAIAAALCPDPDEILIRPDSRQAAEILGGVSPETARFEIYAPSDTVLDNSTGLMWTRGNVAGGRMTWSAAREACAKVVLGGYDDWRLPTIRELLTLVDYERHDPAIDTDVFECSSSWYWTSTPAASAPSEYAWVVGFNGGYAYWDFHDYEGFVRAVRAGQ